MSSSSSGSLNKMKAPQAAPVSGSSAGSGSVGEGSSSGGNGKPNPTMMMPLRSESLAYPMSPTSNFMSRCQFYVRQNAQKVIATVAFVAFVLFISSDYVHDSNGIVDGGHGFLRRPGR
jgi:hypothetical protein